MQTIKKSTLIQLFLLLSVLGLGYLYLIKVDISETSMASNKTNFILNSKINQNVKLHLKTYYKTTKLTCNGNPIALENSKKHDYFYRGQGEIVLPLKRGENLCQAENLSSTLKQKIDFIDFMVLFVLLGIPIFSLLFLAVIWILDFLKKYIKSEERVVAKTAPNFSLWIGLLLLLGMVIRVAYFEKYGIMVFQHDWHGHIEFIKYVAIKGTLPTIPMSGWEFPQQPLYYLMTGGLYSLFVENGFSDQEALHHLGYFSLFCSAIFLYYSYRLLTLLSKNEWVHMVGVIFVSFTPSLVYLSARINNDALVMALSTLSLYLIIKSYQSQFRYHFFMALASVSLLFLTKISTMTIELLFLILLMVAYLQNREAIITKALQKKIYIYGVMGSFVLGMTLLRVYMPLEETFYVVNAGEYPGQVLKHLDSGYFATFNIIDLIQAGQSHIMGEDSVRHSFFTYLYGTMFFGEFDYAYFININNYLSFIMPTILSLGIIYIIGLIGYIITLKNEPILHKILFLIVAINLIMIINFVITYPSICHTDFRFFVGSFSILAFLFARGLEYLSFNLVIKRIISSLLALLAMSEVLFFFAHSNANIIFK
jgi:hypothetical protein